MHLKLGCTIKEVACEAKLSEGQKLSFRLHAAPDSGSSQILAKQTIRSVKKSPFSE